MVNNKKNKNFFHPKNTIETQFILSTLKLEQKILNFKNMEFSSDKEMWTCQKYFRSSVAKRLIGNEILYYTIKKKNISQAHIRKKFKFSKSVISNIFQECVEANWFRIIDTQNNGSQPLYQAAGIMISSVEHYQHYIWQDFDKETLKRFLTHFKFKS